MAGALVARRSYPLVGFLVSSIALCAESVAGLASNASPYANQVAVFSLGLYATRRHARLGPPIVLVSLVLYFAGDPVTPASGAVGVLFVWLATWAVGYSMARRREEQDRARRAVRRQAVAEEQTRVARELHDVVGHTVNLLVVQAGAARLLLDSNPAKARDLLATMEQTGRDSLADLDHVLAHLRNGSRPTDEHPTPGLAQIPDLVDRLTSSRVSVTLTMDPDPPASAQPRSHGVPDRAGSPYQRAQARGTLRRDRRRTPRRRRRGRRSGGRRTRTAASAPSRPRSDRDC